MGCPGPLDLDRGILLQATNLGWENVPIQDALQKALGCEVRIANDVDVGVYGEYRFGAGQNARSVIGVFPGTGIGGGCVYQGNLLRGSRSSCMEIGHMPVMVDGPLCGCGNRGCLEAVASRLAISSAATQAAFRGLAPNLLKAAGTDLANVRSGALAASIAAGDRAIEDIVRHAARMIGMAVGGLVNLLAPDRVVLGGGMVEAMPDLFIAEISTTARNRAMPAYAGTTQFAVAQLGDDAGVLGAAAWAQHCIAPAGE
jgi:glucokinase